MGKKPLPVWPLSLLKHCLSLSYPEFVATRCSQAETLKSQPLPGGNGPTTDATDFAHSFLKFPRCNQEFVETARR